MNIHTKGTLLVTGVELFAGKLTTDNLKQQYYYYNERYTDLIRLPVTTGQYLDNHYRCTLRQFTGTRSCLLRSDESRSRLRCRDGANKICGQIHQSRCVEHCQCSLKGTDGKLLNPTSMREPASSRLIIYIGLSPSGREVLSAAYACEGSCFASWKVKFPAQQYTELFES